MQCAVARPTHGPNALRATEHYLAGVDGLGLTIREMLDLVDTVRMFVNGTAAAELAEPEAQRRGGLTPQQWSEQAAPYLRQVLGAGDHPYLQRLAESPDEAGDEAVFERRLGYVLDGLADLVERRAPDPSS